MKVLVREASWPRASDSGVCKTRLIGCEVELNILETNSMSISWLSFLYYVREKLKLAYKAS